MSTVIIILILLTAPYLLARLLQPVRGRAVDTAGAGAIGLGVVFLFTAFGHFALTEPMVQMLPAWVPQRELLVYVTGLLETAIAIGLFLPRLGRWLICGAQSCANGRTRVGAFIPAHPRSAPDDPDRLGVVVPHMAGAFAPSNGSLKGACMGRIATAIA